MSRLSHSPYAPHDELLPKLKEWQRNFLLLYTLGITGSYRYGIYVVAPDGRQWQLPFESTPARWSAKYMGDTHPAPLPTLPRKFYFEKT